MIWSPQFHIHSSIESTTFSEAIHYLLKFFIGCLDPPFDPGIRTVLTGAGLLLRARGRRECARLSRVTLLHRLLHQHPVAGVRVGILREVRVSGREGEKNQKIASQFSPL